MTERIYDVVVVGGSFAGLNFARLGALSGLDVLLLERHSPVGSVVNTTGVLPIEVLEILQIPRAFLKDAPREMVCISPTLRENVAVLPNAHRWYMSDTGKVLAWLADGARDAGAEIREGTLYQRGEVAGEGVELTVRDREKQVQRIRARYVVGADGARSRVARDFGLSTNQKLLAGHERIVTGVGDGIDSHKVYALFDSDIAPGYFGWLAKHGDGDRAHIGVAGFDHACSPSRSLDLMLDKLGDYVDPSKLVVERSLGGLLPVGGVLDRVVNDHAILVGDAAGMCGPLGCDGIFSSLMSGMAAARVVSYRLQEGDRSALQRYVSEFNRHFNMGGYFRGELLVRELVERFGQDNRDIDRFFDVWQVPAVGEAFLAFVGSHRYAPSAMDWVRRQLLPMILSPAIYAWTIRYLLWRLRGRPAPA